MGILTWILIVAAVVVGLATAAFLVLIAIGTAAAARARGKAMAEAEIASLTPAIKSLAITGIPLSSVVIVNGVERETGPFDVADLTNPSGPKSKGLLVPLLPEDSKVGFIVLDIRRATQSLPERLLRPHADTPN